MQDHEINIIVKNEFFEDNKDLIPLLFDEEPLIFVSPETDMFTILKDHVFFKSKSDARRNWKKTDQEIPLGFTDLTKIGKLNRRLTIWNPIE